MTQPPVDLKPDRRLAHDGWGSDLGEAWCKECEQQTAAPKPQRSLGFDGPEVEALRRDFARTKPRESTPDEVAYMCRLDDDEAALNRLKTKPGGMTEWETGFHDSCIQRVGNGQTLSPSQRAALRRAVR